MKHQSLGKLQKFVTLLDEYSGYAMVQFITITREAVECGNQMITELENIFNYRLNYLPLFNQNSVKWNRSDGGGEYVGRQFQKWLSQRGTVHEVATACSPDSNGNAERLN